MTTAAIVAAMVALAAIIECLLGLVAVRRFARRKPAAEIRGDLPPLTVLKPLCGSEPLLEQALESCLAQAYPEFQIIFGVQDAGDPALGVVAGLRQRFPDADIHVVVDPTMHGPNRKVSNLINMLPFARHDTLVISDSDLHLPPNYLERLVAEMEIPGTGLVTTLYIGVPAPATGWATALGSTQINHLFLPGVLLSRAMGRQDCLGSTAMFRRETLERTGGFHALVHLLAEDNVMGQRVRELGLSIGLADIIPAATVPEPSLGPLWQHEIRWTRTIRELAPLSLCASTLQYAIFWAMVAVGLSRAAPWSFALLSGVWAIRAGCAKGIDRYLRGRVGRPAVATPIWLLPLRDVLSVAEIAASFWVDEVTWRGHKIGARGVVTAPVSVLTLACEPEQLLQEN